MTAVPPLDLVPVWTVLLAFTVAYYVLFDGFDLGVGVLYGFAPRADWRPLIMLSILPVWDGNETWLVLGGLGLLAAFPLAFAIIIPAVYFPIVVMLLALVFRGVAFEFRFKNPLAQRFWDAGFSIGSAIATLAQGVVLGTFIQGFHVNGRQFAGSSLDWASPFAALTAVSLVFGYGLLGAGWLIIKTGGELQTWSRRAARVCLAGVVLAIAAVSIWTPLLDQRIAHRWFSLPNLFWLLPIPVLTAVVAISIWLALGRDSEFWPFLGGILLFLLSFLGIAVSLWPFVVPYHYTLWQAAADESAQVFLLIGTLLLIPIILVYTAWSYWVFRGKVRADLAG
ncbi:MAG: cytochrome d ubiquinol oxidase subunit II [Alphaproteobacteria bacterium]|nr:cytochrome d ubiquinol oxidase subunit II [Alphaproteobacteria bacterium]